MNEKKLQERIEHFEKACESEIAEATLRKERNITQVRKRYEEELTRLNAKKSLRERLEADNGIGDHPKRNLLWEKAWEHGHSGGDHEVEFWYGEFLEMLQ